MSALGEYRQLNDLCIFNFLKHGKIGGFDGGFAFERFGQASYARRMASESAGRLGRWPTVIPFIISGLILDVIGYYIMKTSPHPISNLTGGLVVICVVSGCVLFVLPFLFDAKASLRMDEMDTLAISTRQIKDVQKVVDSISTATAQWMTVQEHSERSVDSARKISDEMTTEARRFSEFMAQANDREKGTLKLENEKLKRGEADWLQVLVMMLDHVFALHQAALRSGQENVVQQLTSFQAACLDAARRVGLSQFAAEEGEDFVTERHQWVQGDGEAPNGVKVVKTVAAGYMMQGQQIRRAVVELEGDADTSTKTANEEETASEEELPLS